MNQSEWVTKLKPFAKPNILKSIFQLITALLPYLILLTGMYLLIKAGYPYWITLLLTMIAGLFLIKIFIIFHDCVHLSFFKSKLLNSVIGHITGALAFTAYDDWGYAHRIHHGTSSNLDKRGIGDVWMLTVKEYFDMKPLQRLWYRIYRNPIFLFLFIPLINFVLINRIPKSNFDRKGIVSVIITDLIIVGIILIVSFTIGIKYYFMIQLPVMFFASMLGVFLFYVQHNYKEEYWAHDKQWEYMRSAMDGSTFFKLPGILRWFTGNIGYHHIHHLKSRIPNYNLKKCYDAVPELRKIEPLTFFKGIKTVFLKLYDEDSKMLVNFSKARKLEKLAS